MAKKQLKIELNEDIYKDLESVVNHINIMDELENLPVPPMTVKILCEGAIIEFLANYKNQQNINYNTDYEKLSKLVNVKTFVDEGDLKNRFKKYMEKQKMTQQQLCYRTGIAKSSLSQYLNNKNQMSLDTFLKIWVALGCPPIEDVLYRE